MSTKIRRAEPRDAKPITEVFIEARTRCLAYLDCEYPLDFMTNLFASRIDGEDEMWVAEKDGVVVGFIRFTNTEVDDLYVLPECHGQGLGKELLHLALREDGELRLWVFQKNLQARRFYERNGFLLEFETDGAENMEKEPDARYLFRAEARPADGLP